MDIFVHIFQCNLFMYLFGSIYIYGSMLNSVEHGFYIYFVGFMLPHCTAAALGEMVYPVCVCVCMCVCVCVCVCVCLCVVVQVHLCICVCVGVLVLCVCLLLC